MLSDKEREAMTLSRKIANERLTLIKGIKTFAQRLNDPSFTTVDVDTTLEEMSKRTETLLYDKKSLEEIQRQLAYDKEQTACQKS